MIYSSSAEQEELQLELSSDHSLWAIMMGKEEAATTPHTGTPAAVQCVCVRLILYLKVL